MNDIAISVKNLTKAYRLFNHPGDRVKQFLTLGRKRYHREFTAIKDVSFDIRKGETVGVIGRNGSGKSTLLQLICGILKPSAGTVQVNGRISALLELGAGFNPEFTGRENVYFQGALMGLGKAQMNDRFDDIATFADIGEFIDQPVRTYSSGMFVRLAFSVAIHVDPGILVVDEALAVGDASFQGRCFERIGAIRRSGGTILLVTHALEQVAHYCDRAILLSEGTLLADDTPGPVLSRYLSTPRDESIQDASALCDDVDLLRRHPAYSALETRWGDGEVSIQDISILQDDRENPVCILPGRELKLKARIAFHKDAHALIYGITIKSSVGAIVFSVNSRDLSAGRLYARRAGESADIVFCFTPFLEKGDYLLSLGVVSETETGIKPHDRRYDVLAFRIAPPLDHHGRVDFMPCFRLSDTP